MSILSDVRVGKTSLVLLLHGVLQVGVERLDLVVLAFEEGVVLYHGKVGI